MANVTLIEHPLSPYAQKVKVALLEKNVPYSTHAPMGASDAQLQTLHAANPRGEVPVLLDDDLALYDSTIILEYIEDRWPDQPLLPAAASERARVRTLEEVQAHEEALAAELDPEAMAAALAAGFQREYRDHRLEWMVRAGGINIVQTGLDAGNIRFTEPFTSD